MKAVAAVEAPAIEDLMAAVSAGKTSPRNAAPRQQAAAQLKGLMSLMVRLISQRAISEYWVAY